MSKRPDDEPPHIYPSGKPMYQHVYPLDDLREHDTNDSSDCWCRPRVEINDHDMHVVIHNSLDGRERYQKWGDLH